ncbi:hypothetical protein HYW54_01965 [Candidatus Gottesmanbacteria bacterium]|nr:hypothetical protein [Candidatus Gottesmanbacteria bacterium]
MVRVELGVKLRQIVDTAFARPPRTSFRERIITISAQFQAFCGGGWNGEIQALEINKSDLETMATAVGRSVEPLLPSANDAHETAKLNGHGSCGSDISWEV